MGFSSSQGRWKEIWKPHSSVTGTNAPESCWRIWDEGPLRYLCSATLQQAAERGLSGGVLYDALIVCAARKAGADRLLTLNQRDFRRVLPEGESILIVP